MLIATLPAVYHEDVMFEIISETAIGGVRYNIGAASPYSPEETLKRILQLTRRFGKKLWVDLKGRQLRIEQWAAPVYGKIVLNHEIKVSGSAQVIFRGDDVCEIKEVRGREIYVDPAPSHAVGAGQAINVHGDVEILGYLTDTDKDYIKAALKLGVYDFMLSFVEGQCDLDEVNDFVINFLGVDVEELEKVLKIETPKGFAFAKTLTALPKGVRLMAARDDWFINYEDENGGKAGLINDLAELVKIDSEAIVASRIFSGIEKTEEPTLADYADLWLMRQFGYKHFMFSDGLCRKHFFGAMEAWKDFERTWTNARMVPLGATRGDR